MNNSIIFDFSRIVKRLHTLWQLSNPESDSIDQQISIQEIVESEPFVVFPCGECEEKILIETHIYPGQAVVKECDNCKTSWTFFAPQLMVRRTKEIPEHLQNVIWGELSQ